MNSTGTVCLEAQRFVFPFVLMYGLGLGKGSLDGSYKGV